jgi:hypothetical protein
MNYYFKRIFSVGFGTSQRTFRHVCADLSHDIAQLLTVVVEETFRSTFKVIDIFWMVLCASIFPFNTSSFIQILWDYMLLNTEGLGKALYIIQSENN